MMNMELDMWNKYMLAVDWSVTLPVDSPSGLFDDIKSDGCLLGDDPLGLHLQDAVEHVRSESPYKNEDILGREWMESSDLNSFLEALGNSNDKLLPLEASLIEYTSSTAPDEPVTFDDFVGKHGLYKNSVNCAEYSSLEDLLSTRPLNNRVGVNRFDALLSSPSSPEQVAPVIKLEPVNTAECSHHVPNGFMDTSLDLFSEDRYEITVDESNSSLETTESKPGVVFDGLDFTSCIDTETSIITTDDGSEFISSPLSADDVESMLSSSRSGSPNSLHSSIIESSPELYKVILTSSVENVKRFSPYSKAKPSKQSKSSSKNLALELTFSEEFEMPENFEHLSKKDRKKLQNKNAAIRYRMKKKEEALGIKSEEQILEEKNHDLKTKVEDLQREIKYMKNLMEDVCRAKGLTFK